MRAITLSVLLALASPVLAEHGEPSLWRPLEDMNTADLAATGWHQVSAATLLGPRAEMVLITFWEGELDGAPVTLRCATGFTPSGSFDRCERPDTSHAAGEVAEE